MAISANFLSRLHGVLAKVVRPGISTKELDKLAEEFIKDNNVKSAFKGFHGFPASICTSVNDCIVHGLPSSKEILKEGDIISIDGGILYKGFNSDSAYTHAVGEVKPEILNLLKVTKESLYKGIAQLKPGNRLGDIGHAISRLVEDNKFFIAEDLVGHGVGRNLHEAPEIPNFGRRGNGVKIKEGMVVAIEPMVNWSDPRIITAKDGSVRTIDGSVSAHFEHTLAVIEGGSRTLTTYDYIEGSSI